MSLNSLNPFISSNSLSSLDSTSTLGAGQTTGGLDSNNSAPNGEQFSVFFERMMHPAFNSASSNTKPADAQSSSSDSSNLQANSGISPNMPLDPSLAAPSAWTSTQALLDSQSQTFSLSQSYLGVSSQSFLDSNTSSSTVSPNDLSSSAPSIGFSSLDQSSLDSETSRINSQDHEESSSGTSQSQRAPSKEEPSSSEHSKQTTQNDSSHGNVDSAPSNAAQEAKTVDKNKAMTDAQKLDLANQSLLTQRLPSATPEVLHPGALKAKNTTNIKGNDSELATISLGPNSQIVTSTKNPPTEKSLSDFAKSMGFTKTAIARLFGSDDSAQAETSPATATQSVLNNGLLATVSNDPNALTSGSTLTANALSPSTLSLSINPTMDAPAAATSLNAGTALNPLSQLPSLSSNNSTLTPTPSIDPALDAAAALTATALPGATAAAVLNPMSGTLNGNLVSANTLTGTINANLGDLNELMMQNGATLKSGSVNFASTLNALNQAGASVSNPSTLSVLNMTGSELTGSAIEALQSEFNKLTNSGHLSSTGEADTNAFGLALTPDANSISAGASRIDLGSNTAGNPSASSGNTADGSSFLNANGSSNVGNMADTYEKLSNQLTAELSRRMNDQISQGQWKMKFALKPSSLGAVDVQIEMKDGKLAANFQADNALTQSLLQHGSNQLKDNLKGLGLTQTDVQVGQNQTQSGSGQNSGSNFAGQNPFAPAPKPQLANANIAQDSNPPVDVSIKGASTDGNLDLFA